MARFCKNCGKELEEGSIFCNECGTKFGESNLHLIIVKHLLTNHLKNTLLV
ncbi:MAG: zinc-ribbon domain-containing protein [Methanobrevibacter sp.]|uniref:zinc-ribbon domain-containing protein n=1 Tax=Methanobrevibacter sp. TaxID=66852 RepID=UPI0031F4CC59|nr:zinc-ribbon domain-containing protein [Methanobrevibacter sp.]